MIVVAWMYNTNGMAAWCWEAAHALHEAGQPVLLVCSHEVSIPNGSPVRIIRFDPPREKTRGLKRKVGDELLRLSPQSSGFTYALHNFLLQEGVQPLVYFLNQTDLQDPRVGVPQYVTGWAFPTSFLGYLSKVGIYAGGKISRTAIRSALSTIGWWGKDWRAYRSANGVLSVSQRLNAEITHHGINSHVVYPGTEVNTEPSSRIVKPPYKMLTVALDLEESRKRVKWLIEGLKGLPDKNRFTVTLIGQASADFRDWSCQDNFPATFTGSLSRPDVQSAMAEHDIFLFGSALDDWGYVLVEAMSRNLCVIAPNISPFDEIVGDTGSLFSANSRGDFCTKVHQLISSNDLSATRNSAWQRASDLFSRVAFGKSLLDAAGIKLDSRLDHANLTS